MLHIHAISINYKKLGMREIKVALTVEVINKGYS